MWFVFCEEPGSCIADWEIRCFTIGEKFFYHPYYSSNGVFFVSQNETVTHLKRNENVAKTKRKRVKMAVLNAFLTRFNAFRILK